MLRVNLSRQSAKFIRKLTAKHARQVAAKITQLRNNPYPQDSLKLIRFNCRAIAVRELPLFLSHLLLQLFSFQQGDPKATGRVVIAVFWDGLNSDRLKHIYR